MATAKQKIPKGYKQTEIGVIPEDWSIEPIKYLATITTGSKNTQDRVNDGLYPFFVRSQTIERINSYSYDGEAVLTAGDGVGTGKVFHYVNGKFDIHQRVYKISDFNKQLNGYFFFLYFSNNFFNRIMQMTAKSSVDSVRMEMIADMQIPVPPEHEQTAIATVLSDTDALIESLEKLIIKKKAIKQSAMQQLLTGKKRLSEFEKKKGYKLSEIGVIPKDWDIISYGEAFDFLSTASYSRAELSDNDEVLYVHYGDIHTTWNYFLDFKKNILPAIEKTKVKNYSFIKDGDLIMADASEDYDGIGKSVEVKNITTNKAISGLHTFLLRGKEGVFANGFKGYIHSNRLVKISMDRLATGLKVYGVSKINLKTIQIPQPTVPEQTAIATILSDMDAEIESLEQKRNKYTLIKQGMMQELLTGKTRLICEKK